MLAIVNTLVFRTPGAHRQDWVLGTMVFALHRVVQILSSCMKDISRNRVHQGYSPEGFFQGHFKTHDSEAGFEPTLIVLQTIELTIFLFQIIAVCVFSFHLAERRAGVADGI